MINKKIAITISIISLIVLGIMFGYIIYDSNSTVVNNGMILNNDNVLAIENNQEISVVQTSVEEEKTTPNTLIVYKTFKLH